MGMSAGSRSASQLDWVKNIRVRAKDEDEHLKNDYNASCAFAMFWNLCRTILPDNIISDIEEFMKTAGPDMRMDGHGRMPINDDGTGEFTLSIGGEHWKFCKAHLAPPAGVMASNYAR